MLDNEAFRSFAGGATRNRTGDTRIFSPLLYQLSYGTLLSRMGLFPFCVAKVGTFSEFAKCLWTFLMLFVLKINEPSEIQAVHMLFF